MEQKDPISIVHDIFNDFFGEDNVDLQDFAIIVHFPNVTVTNEHNRSIDITELWAKINLNVDGTIDGIFSLIRSEYTDAQFISGYSHSHIPTKNAENFHLWERPCLGKGPIKGTIASLTQQFSEEIWELFCLELSKYVTTESTLGWPYKRLEEVNTENSFRVMPGKGFVNESDLPPILVDTANKFIPYILEKKPFRFNYANGNYGIASCHKDLMVILSNTFIDWYNSLPANERIGKNALLTNGIMGEAKLINGALHYISTLRSSTRLEYRSLIGRSLFKFKNKDVRFNVTKEKPARDPNRALILSVSFVELIMDRILKTVNNKYGRQETTPTTRKTLRYL